MMDLSPVCNSHYLALHNFSFGGLLLIDWEKKNGNYENAYLLIMGEMKCELKNIVMYCQLIDILF